MDYTSEVHKGKNQLTFKNIKISASKTTSATLLELVD